MASAVFAKSGNGGYDLRIGPTYDKWQVALAILYGPLVLTIVLGPRDPWRIAVLILPWKINEMIEPCNGRSTWIVTAQVVKQTRGCLACNSSIMRRRGVRLVDYLLLARSWRIDMALNI